LVVHDLNAAGAEQLNMAGRFFGAKLRNPA
jgi:hypothetical protein